MALLTDIKSLFGHNAEIESIFVWQVLQQFVGAVLAPFVEDVTKEMNRLAPTKVLSPTELANLVLRGWVDQTSAAHTASSSGVTNADFDLMVKGTGEPPGLETVMQWYRRGIVPWSSAPGTASVEEAIRTSRIITDVWANTIRLGNVVPIPVAEAVDAVIEGQISIGTRGQYAAAAAGGVVAGAGAAAVTGYGIAWSNGITPDQFDVMVHTRGNPPPPSELITLFRRGLIPWTGTGFTATTVQQGIYEGATKDKWEPIFKGLVRAVPSIYELRTMLKTGSITAAEGTAYLQDEGYTATAIAGILSAANAEAAATDRKLAQSTITTLYYDLAIPRTEAATLLGDIGYGPQTATFMLSVQDMKREMTALTAAVSKVGGLFVARKLTVAAATSALSVLGIPASQVTGLLESWTVERTSNVRLLTESQVADAVYYQIMDITSALQSLVDLGYTPYDAWVVISVRMHGPQGTAPAQTATALTGNIT